MRQGTKPGDMFEELLIGNYDLAKQAEINNHFLFEQACQMTLFDFQYRRDCRGCRRQRRQAVHVLYRAEGGVYRDGVR